MSSRSCRPLWLWMVVVSWPVWAQEVEPLDLRSAVERSLATHPQLKSLGFELAAREGRLESARARPNLEVGVAVEDVLGSGTHRDFDDAETTLTVAWVWERGAREHRIATAQAEMTSAQSEVELRRLDVATETARRFVALLTHQQELEELKRALSLAEASHATVEARVAAAKAPEAEAARSFAQLARARLDLEHEEHELLTASAKLAAMWGDKPLGDRQSVSVHGDLLTLPSVPEYVELSARVSRNPNLARLATVRRVREAELELAMAQRPSWQVSAGIRRFEATDDQALVFGLTAPFADRRTSRGAIAAARANLSRVNADNEMLVGELSTELFAMFQEMKHAHTEANALRDEVLPRMEKALSEARYAYERGRYSYLEWLSIQREVTEIRRALIAASANAHLHRIEIERLTGTSLGAQLNRSLP